MTNGEKIKEIFPNLRITVCEFYVQVMGEHYEFSNTYPLKWWNAEYKEPSGSEIPNKSEKPNKSEIPTSLDCVDRHSVDLLAYRYLKEPTDNHVAFYDNFLNLPSVTPIRPKGSWIWVFDETPSTPDSPCEVNYAGWVCSCCHKFPDNICEWDDPGEPPTYKCCPNCGAEMESEKA